MPKIPKNGPGPPLPAFFGVGFSLVQFNLEIQISFTLPCLVSDFHVVVTCSLCVATNASNVMPFFLQHFGKSDMTKQSLGLVNPLNRQKEDHSVETTSTEAALCCLLRMRAQRPVHLDSCRALFQTQVLCRQIRENRWSATLQDFRQNTSFASKEPRHGVLSSVAKFVCCVHGFCQLFALWFVPMFYDRMLHSLPKSNLCFLLAFFQRRSRIEVQERLASCSNSEMWIGPQQPDLGMNFPVACRNNKTF